MRNIILAAAAAVIAVAAPAAASAQTGYVGALYTNTEFDGDDDADAWGAEGAVFFPTSSALGVEVDAAVIDGDESDTAYALTGHLFTRSDRYLFGGFVGVADSDDDTVWNAGLEANKFYDRWTLNGAIGYVQGEDDDQDAWGVNVGASLFATDNFRVDANVGWLSADDDDALALGVGAEYQFASLPVSVGASYAHIDYDDADAEFRHGRRDLALQLGRHAARSRSQWRQPRQPHHLPGGGPLSTHKLVGAAAPTNCFKAPALAGAFLHRASLDYGDSI